MTCFSAAIKRWRKFTTSISGNRMNPVSAQKLEAVSHIEPQSPETGQQGTNRPPSPPTLSRVLGTLERLAVTVDSADAAPTTQATQAADETIQKLEVFLGEWEKIK